MIDDFCDAGGEFGFEFGGEDGLAAGEAVFEGVFAGVGFALVGFGAGGFLGVLTVCGFSGFGCLV